MKAAKRKRLEAKGWRLASVEEFLGLSREELAIVEMKLALADAVKVHARKSHLSDRTRGPDEVKPVKGC
jgi:hypothetical protein